MNARNRGDLRLGDWEAGWVGSDGLGGRDD